MAAKPNTVAELRELLWCQPLSLEYIGSNLNLNSDELHGSIAYMGD